MGEVPEYYPVMQLIHSRARKALLTILVFVTVVAGTLTVTGSPASAAEYCGGGYRQEDIAREKIKDSDGREIGDVQLGVKRIGRKTLEICAATHRLRSGERTSDRIYARLTIGGGSIRESSSKGNTVTKVVALPYASENLKRTVRFEGVIENNRRVEGKAKGVVKFRARDIFY